MAIVNVPDLNEMLRAALYKPEFVRELILLQVAEEAYTKSENLGLSHAEYAALIPCTPHLLTRVFSTSARLTPLLIAKLALAADCDVEIKFVPRCSPREAG